MPTIKQIRDDAAKAIETVAGETAKRVEDVTAEVTRSSETARSEAARVATDPTPFYAIVGLTDTVVERARTTVAETVARAGKVGRSLTPKTISQSVTDRAAEVSKFAESLPGKTVNDVTEGLGKVQEGYQGLAQRGQGLVGRVRDQQATKDLTKQVSTVVEQGKHLLGAASQGVTDTRSAAKATVTQGRRQAADVVAGEGVTVSSGTRSRKSTAKAAHKATATKSSATKPASKSTASKSSATKSASKSAATKPASKSAATKSASKSTATKSTATKPASKSTATKTTRATAKRTASTASNAAAKTGKATQSMLGEAAKAADKAADAATASAAKVGD